MKLFLILLSLFLGSAALANDQGLLQEVNKARRIAGLSALVENEKLSAVAGDYARLMAESGCFSHDCPPLGPVGDRMLVIGYNWSTLGEALAAGTDLASDTVRGWLESPQHRPIVLSARALEAGTAFAFNGEDAIAGGYGSYWVLIVARP